MCLALDNGAERNLLEQDAPVRIEVGAGVAVCTDDHRQICVRTNQMTLLSLCLCPRGADVC